MVSLSASLAEAFSCLCAAVRPGGRTEGAAGRQPRRWGGGRRNAPTGRGAPAPLGSHAPVSREANPGPGRRQARDKKEPPWGGAVEPLSLQLLLSCAGVLHQRMPDSTAVSSLYIWAEERTCVVFSPALISQGK
ncbi:hypothetical protein AAFF_G00394070 [Aldrovandia affinis]|uniref:Uncharacterized protein n=1 Tax=Aldrovandia affinis TaxID=143900 RepID=A0AAD7SE21_9TELE|nr:hypothetical protein AAFF_G00394070 [Aldrovandia affinis]